MRKLLSLLALLLALCPAARALSLPYPADTALSVLELTDAQRALAEALYTPIFNHQENIPLPGGTRYDDVRPAMNALMQDCPELFHLGRNFTVTYYRDAPEIAVSLQPEYRMTAEEAASARAALYAEAYLLASADTDPLALHDALCSRVVYGGDTETCHTAVGALLEGRATCEGYAQALTLVYRMAGIPCAVVVGEAADAAGVTERHAWNLAALEGYTLIDATWNDQDRLGFNTHWYYGLSTAQMGADHFPDAGQAIPRCGGQDNWHARHGLVVNTRAEAAEALRGLAETGMVNLRATEDALFRLLTEDTHALIEGYNARTPEAAFYGTYSVACSAEQRCVVIRRVEE